MGTPYIQGLLEGFRGRGEEVYQQAIKDDQERRKMEGQLFNHLLQSRDPQIRALALQGIYEGAQPSSRKKGWRGFLGEIQSSSVFPQIQQLASELVPDEPPTPRAPSAPGAAAMSTNVPVEQPSTPMRLTTGPTGQETITNAPAAPRLEDVMPSEQLRTAAPPPPAMVRAQADQNAQAAQAPAAPQLAGPQLEGPVRMRPRGTGVPTAEEIAEFNATVGPRTRIAMAQEFLGEEDAKRAIMGILGAPQAARQFGAPTFAVMDPLNNTPVPVAFDYASGRFFFTDGTPVPRGAKFVQLPRSSSSAGLTTTIRDSPEVREQYGIEPDMVTPSGYWRIKQAPDGTTQVMASEYTPPPAYSGTTEVLEDGVTVRAPVRRGGGLGPALGDAPRTDPPEVQQQAKGLLAAVDRMLTQEQVGPGGLRRRVTPERMNALVKQEAVKLGLPYQTYAELQQAANVTPNITPRQEREQAPNAGMTMADRIRARALALGARSTPTTPYQPPPPAPAPQPSARSRGAGPRK